MKDENFIKYFSLIKKAAIDQRNFVKKAVNWALRQIGKRNKKLNEEAIKVAREIRQLAEKNNSKSIRWIANNALTELTSESVQKRLSIKEKNNS
jgi:3-methyladenine DNA glycosylase AlkD